MYILFRFYVCFFLFHVVYLNMYFGGFSFFGGCGDACYIRKHAFLTLFNNGPRTYRCAGELLPTS